MWWIFYRCDAHPGEIEHPKRSVHLLQGQARPRTHAPGLCRGRQRRFRKRFRVWAPGLRCLQKIKYRVVRVQERVNRYWRTLRQGRAYIYIF